MGGNYGCETPGGGAERPAAQFLTRIDGLDIHFIHVPSKHADEWPLIVTHGWPGSIIEQLKIVDQLTNPTPYGGSASAAFYLVIPSIPATGSRSDPPNRLGSRPCRTDLAVPIKRLGYASFVAAGGDVGALVNVAMAYQAPQSCSAFTPTSRQRSAGGHRPGDAARRSAAGRPPPDRATRVRQLAEPEREAPRVRGRDEHPPADAVRHGDITGGQPGVLAPDHGDGDDQPAAAIVSALRGTTST